MQRAVISEDDYLQLSGLQHFVFCKRQWALISIEQQWLENVRTVEGELFHRVAHDAGKIEKRGNLLIVRGLRIKSKKLGLSGICDVVEFHEDPRGVSIFSQEGLWYPYPVEYKRGKPKEHQADEMQLCAQAICLEEMLLCQISEGSLFYGESRRRTEVVFTDELRDKVFESTREMHLLWERGHTPKVKTSKSCNACSLAEVCLPRLNKVKPVKDFIDNVINDGN